MTETKQETELAGSAERLLHALRAVAGDLGGSDALSELGERARGIVADLAARRNVVTRDASPSATARFEEPATAAAPVREPADDRLEHLPRRIHELRACVEEVADVLDATVSRLETIEAQLGDPRASLGQSLRDGIERCERVLAGIEHRVESGRRPETPEVAAEVDSSRPNVLVVAAASRRRADLCIALEKQGLRTLAAMNLPTALDIAGRRSPECALVVLDGPEQARMLFLDEWKEWESDGALPPAALFRASGDARPAGESFELPCVDEDHGAAAMAALLKSLPRMRRSI